MYCRRVCQALLGGREEERERDESKPVDDWLAPHISLRRFDLLPVLVLVLLPCNRNGTVQ